MITDEIAEISIDGDGRLLVRPQVQTFPDVYRAGMEVGWDPRSGTLFSPTPRERSYPRWFQQILGAAAGEFGVSLIITSRTKWAKVSETLRAEIEAQQKAQAKPQISD